MTEAVSIEASVPETIGGLIMEINRIMGRRKFEELSNSSKKKIIKTVLIFKESHGWADFQLSAYLSGYGIDLREC